jgi:hypothetical protein
MAQRAAISILAFVAAAMPARGSEPSVPPALPSGWTLDCHAGEDGFAHNCEAIRSAGDYVLRLVTADAQVFVAVLHPRCDTNYRNFDRTDMVGLDPAERRALTARAVHEIEAEIHRTCPSLAPPALALDALPDIAILSPDTDH